jgi:hypothetical protein
MAPVAISAASEDGKWYVIVRPRAQGQETGFQLVERRDGAIPAARAEQGEDLVPTPGSRVAAEGPCPMPMEVRCLDGGQGFVLFETYANLGHGEVLRRHDGQGGLRWALRLRDLFSEAEIAKFLQTVSSIWWYRGLWIDGAGGDVVIVASGPRILRVALEDGRVKPGRAEDLLLRVGRGSREEQVLALDTALEMRPAGLLPVARAAFDRPDVPPLVRVRLAVLLAREGERAGVPLVVSSAGAGVEDDVRGYALSQLPTVLGADALPVLRDAMRGTAGGVWSAAQQGFVALGEAAVGTLAEMALEAGESDDYRGGAAHALRAIGPRAKAAVPALVESARTMPEYTANAAMNALVEILPPAEVSPLFARLLEQGSGDDARLALFFQEHPSAAAAPGLVAALERLERRPAKSGGTPDDTTRDWILEALKASTGHDAGATAAAWRAWLGRSGR